jgi:hypothetical protein
MLEPLSAFGTAANVLQFIDLACKLIGYSVEAYRSTQGTSDDDLTAALVVEDLRTFSAVLPHRKLGIIASRTQDGQFIKLVNKCNELSIMMLEKLEAVRIPQDARFRGVQAIGKAMRRAMDREAREKMERQLEAMRNEISLRMLGMLDDEQSNISAALRKMATTNEAMHMDLMRDLSEMRQDLQAYLVMPSKIDDSDQPDNSLLAERPTEALMQLLTAMNKEGRVVSTSQGLLSSLRFNEMPLRHSQIPIKYKKTFKWVFDEGTCPFASWLRKSTGIFWVGGKAGSGKSTLLKFIAGDITTRQMLQQWANDKRLLVASYYFWSAGYPMQRSQEGLLMSLLYEVLRQAPDLIPLVCPQRWKTMGTAVEQMSWSLAELLTALKDTVSAGGPDSMFCFFVDGLDEFEGDHYVLVKSLEDLSQLPNVKLCVSSRPWNVFTKAYGRSTGRALSLQDYTKVDMDKYITGMLEQDQRFAELAAHDGTAWTLVQEIRERADGVFLWVFLVVRSLLRGLNEDDDAIMLHRRLRSLPDTLEKFFANMLESIEEVYQEFMGRTLQIMTAADTPLQLVLFSFIERDFGDAEYALKMPVAALQSPEKMYDNTLRLINKWCRDLLEVSQESVPHPSEKKGPWQTVTQHHVTFLHRSVRDYLQTDEMAIFLRSKCSVDFNPRLALCRLLLAQAKTLESTLQADRNAIFMFIDRAEQVIHFARSAEIHDGISEGRLLLALDQAGEQVRKGSVHDGGHWTDYEQEGAGPVRYRFWQFALCHGLSIFLDTTLHDTTVEIITSHPELLRRAASTKQGLCYDVVEMLLRNGWKLDDARVVLDRQIRQTVSDKNGILISELLDRYSSKSAGDLTDKPGMVFRESSKHNEDHCQDAISTASPSGRQRLIHRSLNQNRVQSIARPPSPAPSYRARSSYAHQISAGRSSKSSRTDHPPVSLPSRYWRALPERPIAVSHDMQSMVSNHRSSQGPIEELHGEQEPDLWRDVDTAFARTASIVPVQPTPLAKPSITSHKRKRSLFSRLWIWTKGSS